MELGTEGRRGESRKSQGINWGRGSEAGAGQVAWSWAEAIKVPFFSVPDEQTPNTQPLGQVRNRVSP